MRQHLDLFSGAGMVVRLTFDETGIRPKLGAKPIAITPVGEVVAMGAAPVVSGNPVFSFRSCGVLRVNADANALCRPDEPLPDQGGDAAEEGAEKPTAQPAAGQDISAGSVSDVFRRVTPMVRDWTVDTDGLPESCRVPQGCLTPKGRFVSLRGIRLTRHMFTGHGTGYAMSDGIDLATAFNSRSPEDKHNALVHVATDGSKVPGNLDDNYLADTGIDCSGLVQIAWGGGGRLSTGSLQGLSGVSYVCPKRLPDASWLRPGDAIGLNVTGSLHHVVLYAGRMRFDGASDGWLILDSASACDGVCWSVYDPSFFSGWGMYRTGRAIAPTSAVPKRRRGRHASRTTPEPGRGSSPTPTRGARNVPRQPRQRSTARRADEDAIRDRPRRLCRHRLAAEWASRVMSETCSLTTRCRGRFGRPPTSLWPAVPPAPPSPAWPTARPRPACVRRRRPSRLRRACLR